MKIKMMKTFIATLLFLVSAMVWAEQPLRHFMQSSPSPEGAIPYGNNTEAGHYAEADGARIYYEVYGT